MGQSTDLPAAKLIVLSGIRYVRAATRREVLDRDGMTCQTCGGPVRILERGEHPARDQLHFAHDEAWAAGGSNDADNIFVSCAHCNLTEPAPPTILRWRRVRVEFRDDDYYWEDGYSPPRVALDGELHHVSDLAAAMGVRPKRVLYMIANGMMCAAATNPVRAQHIELITFRQRRQRAHFTHDHGPDMVAPDRPPRRHDIAALMAAKRRLSRRQQLKQRGER